MGEYHDESATLYGNIILSKIRNADPVYKQVFSPNLIRVGDWDWPRPDYVCYDETLGVTYALEFKPPFQSKREYLTGLGQSLSYLRKHAYSGLIVPNVADDGFRIADFICDVLKSSEFVNIPTSLYAYNYAEQSIKILKQISQTREVTSLQKQKPEIQTFWCWWRDMSHYELYDLLYLSFIYSEADGDIYSDHIYPYFYNMMINKQTRQWDGTPRNKLYSERSKKAEKQNYNIPLVQLELWTRGEGRLTDLGYKLLDIGKKYRPESKKFIDCLAYLVLVNGKHLDLINWVNRFQKNMIVPAKASDYAVALEKYLSENGCIGKRKPGAVTTGAKNSYMRDEMKLWNKFGFVIAHNGSYFFPNKGYIFDWERISEVLIAGRIE